MELQPRLPVLMFEGGIFQKPAVDLGSDFQYIFNLNRFDLHILNVTTQYPSFTLLA